MYNTIIISIDELWLKGKNRPFYFKTLKKNIKLLLKSLGRDNTSVSIENHRFIVNSDDPFSKENILAISNIPGTNSIIPAVRIEKSYEAIFPAVEKEINGYDLSTIRNFRIYMLNLKCKTITILSRLKIYYKIMIIFSGIKR